MFNLSAVKCKNCDSGLTVEVNDNIVYCSSCGSGFEIIDGEFQPIEINFAAPAIRENAEMIYKPFWIAKTSINIHERTTSGGLLKNIFSSTDKNFSTGNIMFYIPAFYCSLENLKNIATQFTLKHPVASPQKYNVKLTGFAYGKDDAKKLSEFLLISLEAEKKDTVKKFRYDMKFDEMQILGIPFYKMPDGRLKDAVLGVVI